MTAHTPGPGLRDLREAHDTLVYADDRTIADELEDAHEAAAQMCAERDALRARCGVLEAALRGMVGMARLERNKPAWKAAADIAEDTLRAKVRGQP